MPEFIVQEVWGLLFVLLGGERVSGLGFRV